MFGKKQKQADDPQEVPKGRSGEGLAMRLVPAGEDMVRGPVRDLYVRAFPACERKPCEVILQKQQAGELDVFAVEESGRFCGLAVTIRYQDIVLLDYFAIEESVRNSGYGSRALEMLCKHYRGKRFILEVESTFSSAPNQGQRVARKGFYMRNGWKELGMLVFIYETQMELLGYDTCISFEEYADLYRMHYPERIPRLLSPEPS